MYVPHTVCVFKTMYMCVFWSNVQRYTKDSIERTRAKIVAVKKQKTVPNKTNTKKRNVFSLLSSKFNNMQDGSGGKDGVKRKNAHVEATKKGL